MYRAAFNRAIDQHGGAQSARRTESSRAPLPSKPPRCLPPWSPAAAISGGGGGGEGSSRTPSRPSLAWARPRVPVPSVPSTSLLSLPDNLILEIFELVYEDRRRDDANRSRPKIQEILINKRVYHLVRSLWLSSLSIDDAHIDLRFANLVKDQHRCDLIRRLEICLCEDLANLTLAVIDRMPRLSHLTLVTQTWSSHKFRDVLSANVNQLQRLERIDLILEEKDYQLSSTLASLLDRAAGSMKVTVQKQLHFARQQKKGGDERALYGLGPGDDSAALDWSSIRSLTLKSYEDASIVLTSLYRHLADLRDYSSPLRQLALCLCSRPPSNAAASSATVANLFRALKKCLAHSKFRVVRLELADVQTIPSLSNAVARSIKVFKLSGSFSFKMTYDFRDFSSMLDVFPSLTQLHLVGSSIFGSNATAQSISRVEKNHRGFLWPELGFLLVHLRGTHVKIFTFRSESEPREMRWTRLTNDDEFDSDCWTIEIAR